MTILAGLKMIATSKKQCADSTVLCLKTFKRKKKKNFTQQTNDFQEKTIWDLICFYVWCVLTKSTKGTGMSATKRWRGQSASHHTFTNCLRFLMSHIWFHRKDFSSPKATTGQQGGQQEPGSTRTARKGINTKNMRLSSKISPPCSHELCHCERYFSQALLVYEHSIHPLPPAREVNNGGKWVSWFHCTFAFEWALMNQKAPEVAGCT